MIKNYLEKEKSISIITEGSIAGLSYSYSDNSFNYLNHILMYDYYSEIEKNEFYEWVDPKEPIVFLETLFILPEYQGRGLYKIILDNLYEVCYNNGIFSILLVADLNQRQEESFFNLITFYELNGFKILKELENNQYLMIKKIN